jgi:hypothetical protein
VKQSLAANKDFAGSPVDVLELESDHFPGAKTKTGEEKKDGIVAAAHPRAAVARLEHTFDLPRRDVSRHGGQLPIRYGRYRGRQVGGQLPPLKQIPEERAESRRHLMYISDTPTLAMPQNERRNIGSFHFFSEERSLGEALLEKFASKAPVMRDRSSGESTLGT